MLDATSYFRQGRSPDSNGVVRPSRRVKTEVQNLFPLPIINSSRHLTYQDNLTMLQNDLVPQVLWVLGGLFSESFLGPHIESG